MSELPWTRVYRPRNAAEAHLRREDAAVIACEDPARMSSYPGREERWYGTGSQEEYEHAAELPLCLRCQAVREGWS